jgi:hypothetical protein
MRAARLPSPATSLVNVVDDRPTEGAGRARIKADARSPKKSIYLGAKANERRRALLHLVWDKGLPLKVPSSSQQ